jgi:hypothetical protein
MEMIFERNIENSDFFELILTEKELEKLDMNKNLVKDFPEGLFGVRNLNVFIRIDNKEEEICL